MGRFALTRGWLECRYESVPDMRDRAAAWATRGPEYQLTPMQAELYARGWVFPEAPLNYTSVVFFGADVRALALPFVRSMIEDVASVEDDAEGMFFVDDDEGDAPLLWRVADGRVLEEARPPQLA